jgi:IS1 family transposase
VLPPHGAAVAYTGFQSVDLHWGDPASPGLHLWVVAHQYEEVSCACGHQTRAQPAQGALAPTLATVQLREWRLVGAGLASVIVALSLRFRLSRARIQEFLWTWLGVRLSIGTIHQTLHEAAAAVAPAEPELIAAIQASDLLHADETSWPQQRQLRWLWVFLSTTTTLYVIADRGKDTVTRLLAGFSGWLMSDGWCSYRSYPQRLRCWAHLVRKAHGLVECYDPTGRAFGRVVLSTLETLMVAIYAARDGPPGAPVDLPSAHAARIAGLRQACIQNLGHRHEKTRALAVELTNDWAAIFQVLSHPHLPLTNNAAERALRHWVIARAISHGTRTNVGSRVFALLASVIDTCRQRGHSPWPYLAAAITDRRAGLPLAPLPQPGV